MKWLNTQQVNFTPTQKSPVGTGKSKEEQIIVSAGGEKVDVAVASVIKEDKKYLMLVKVGAVKTKISTEEEMDKWYSELRTNTLKHAKKNGYHGILYSDWKELMPFSNRASIRDAFK